MPSICGVWGKLFFKNSRQMDRRADTQNDHSDPHCACAQVRGNYEPIINVQ